MKNDRLGNIFAEHNLHIVMDRTVNISKHGYVFTAKEKHHTEMYKVVFSAYKRPELILSLSAVLSASSRSAFHFAHTRTKQKKRNTHTHTPKKK